MWTKFLLQNENVNRKFFKIALFLFNMKMAAKKKEISALLSVANNPCSRFTWMQILFIRKNVSNNQMEENHAFRTKCANKNVDDDLLMVSIKLWCEKFLVAFSSWRKKKEISFFFFFAVLWLFYSLMAVTEFFLSINAKSWAVFLLSTYHTLFRIPSNIWIRSCAYASMLNLFLGIETLEEQKEWQKKMK